MRMRMFPAAFCLTVLGALSSQVRADLPTTWDVTYGIHESPTDPDSRITFTVKLLLERAAWSGNSIGWRVTSVEIRQFDVSGGTIDAWTAPNPTVQTADGLWWIDHTDAEHPQTSEFASSPHVAGTADAQDPTHAALQYDIEGVPYEPPPAPDPPPYEITTALNWRFVRTGEQNPISEGERKPTETDPPMGT